MDTQNSNAPQNTQSKNTLMGILAYLGLLVIIPYLVAKDDSFVKFHIRQGLVLVVIEIAVWFIGMIVWPFMIFIPLVNLAVLVLVIIGIVNVVQGKEKELPLVGQFSSYFKI